MPKWTIAGLHSFPSTLDGLPYVRRDGERVPGTELYEPLSERYDRTRLQRLFVDTTVLALAWATSGDGRFAAHAAGRCDAGSSIRRRG